MPHGASATMSPADRSEALAALAGLGLLGDGDLVPRSWRRLQVHPRSVRRANVLRREGPSESIPATASPEGSPVARPRWRSRMAGGLGLRGAR